MNLAEIAKKVGVCKATVSLVLNGKAKQHHISDATIRKVQDCCRAMNYQRNIHAVRMGKNVVGNIMVLLNTCDGVSSRNSFTDYVVAQIVGGIAQEAETVGYAFTIRLFNPSLNQDIVFNSFRSHEVDGMIYYGFEIPSQWLEVFRREHRLVAGIGIEPLEGISTVNINNRVVSEELTELLIRSGRRRFLYLAGNEGSYPGKERLTGFLDALKKHGIPFRKDSILRGHFQEQTAHEALLAYCAGRGEPPDAVVCANDRMAIGAISALRSLGISVPERTAVAGGDNIEVARYMTPSLTTYDSLPEELGKTAFRLLYAQINGKSSAKDLILNSRIVQGESA